MRKLFNDYQPFINDRNDRVDVPTGHDICGGSRVTRQIPPGGLPTDTELLRSLRASWEERGKLLDKLLVARMVDLASVATLIDRSANSDALSELRGIILEAVEVIKGLRGGLEVKNDPKT